MAHTIYLCKIEGESSFPKRPRNRTTWRVSAGRVSYFSKNMRTEGSCLKLGSKSGTGIGSDDLGMCRVHSRQLGHLQVRNIVINKSVF